MGNLVDSPHAACRIGVAAGRLVVTPAAEGGGPAVLVAEEGITIVVDGRAVGSRAEVLGHEAIDVDLGATAPETEVVVEVDDDGMEARLRILRRPGFRYVLADAAPAGVVTLSRWVAEEIPAPPPTQAEVLSALAARGISVGLDAQAVAHAVLTSSPVPVAVAHGTPPVPSVDAEVTLPFAAAREADPFHTVPRGTLVAVKTPARQGRDGLRVTGEPVPVRPPVDVPLAAGVGTVRTQDEDGTVRLHAAVDGRPGRAGPSVIVEARFTHQGDIDVSTGDVRVLGSLVVTGIVGEGRSVHASGHLEIVGGVDRADVEAGETLTVHGPALHSHLRAGARHAARSRLLAELADAPEDLAVLAETLSAVVAASHARGADLPVGRALIALLESRFASVPARLEAAAQVVREHPYVFAAPVGEAVAAGLHATTHLGPHELHDPADLAALAEALAAALAPVREEVAAPADTSVSYMQCCRMESSGPLVITGHGVYTSEIFVGGDLSCENPGSTIRGGVTRSTGRVRVHELGAEGGARTVLALDGPAGGVDRLHVDVVHPGVRVQGAGREIAIDARATDVRAGIDEQGQLVVS